MGKKRQKKSGSTKKRKKQHKGGRAEAEAESDTPIQADGAMSNMVGGFRRAVGVEKGDAEGKRGLMDGALLWLLLIVVVVLVAWRFAD